MFIQNRNRSVAEGVRFVAIMRVVSHTGRRTWGGQSGRAIHYVEGYGPSAEDAKADLFKRIKKGIP